MIRYEHLLPRFEDQLKKFYRPLVNPNVEVNDALQELARDLHVRALPSLFPQDMCPRLDKSRVSCEYALEPLAAHISDWYQNRNSIRVCCSNVDATFTVLESLIQRRVSVDELVTLHIVAG